MTVNELARRIGHDRMRDDLWTEFDDDVMAHTGQHPGVDYEYPKSVPDGVARYWIDAFESNRAVVRVERPREFWRANYTACLSEATRALQASDALDVQHVLQILPTLAEAAQLPELTALEAEIRRAAGEPVSEAERLEARAAVTWIGTPPRDAIA